MASSSLPTPPCTYDVFVNFRGEDTRPNFTDHVVTTLERKKIYVYIDDKDVERGKEISIELEQAIKTSRMAVIVFSKNCANSEWCLNELVMIMDCYKSRCNQTFTVLPIFYHVSPSDVSEQKGDFAKDQLSNGTERHGEEMERSFDGCCKVGRLPFETRLVTFCDLSID